MEKNSNNSQVIANKQSLISKIEEIRKKAKEQKITVEQCLRNNAEYMANINHSVTPLEKKIMEIKNRRYKMENYNRKIIQYKWNYSYSTQMETMKQT